MDQKTPIQLQELPVPAACTAECRRQKHSRKGRAFKALGFSTLLLWLGTRYFRFPSPMTFRESPSQWPFPPDVTVDHCAEYSDPVETEGGDYPLYSADASLELPASADTLFLISRSHHHGGRVFSTGNVNYLQSDEVTNTVKVDITAYFWREEHLQASKACLLKRDDDQTGVGIFTKWEGKRRRENERLRLDVTVTFPRTEDNSALAINNFSSDLEIFTQTVADLSNIDFKTLSLKAALSAIRAESLVARNATIRTSLGPIMIQSLIGETASIVTNLGAIEGTFNSSKSLTLSTSNGPINVEVNLFNNDEDDAAKLKLLTSNGRIEGRINLESTKKSGSAFNITARTSHGPIDLDVVAAPLESNITLGATTSLGSLSAKLPTTFEGEFHASTSLSSLQVKVDENAEDPAGKGRKRHVDHRTVGKASSHGYVSWSEEGKTRGSVVVRSSLGPVSLEF
ncbi:hypothetical protein B0H16DRAFT_1501021 [Mycena metata]|uniref:DUF7330 domain-containing protein n=1 Tax=Mycena metata TaxID=1033252 RepID=A0AAD7K859_9AGAR|nr:hypothetical protein B0H16DRAFT_1501021 [Mycena metata]